MRISFPAYSILVDNSCVNDTEHYPLLSIKELKAVNSMESKNEPPEDGIPAEVHKLVFHHWPNILIHAFNASLNETNLLAWKRRSLQLINKGKDDPELPSAYRPLCMLVMPGKVFEALIRSRLVEAMRVAGDISPRQFSFRSGGSTVDVVAVYQAEAHSRRSWRVGLLVTLLLLRPLSRSEPELARLDRLHNFARIKAGSPEAAKLPSKESSHRCFTRPFDLFPSTLMVK